MPNGSDHSLQTHARLAKALAGQTVAITGSSGFLGTALKQALTADGCNVQPLKHGQDWEAGSSLPAGKLKGVDVVIHLAGESIMGRWTDKKKKAIVASRVAGTKTIAQACARDQVPVMLSGSAVGFYGDRGAKPINENDGPGEGFLADACVAWEHATQVAESAGCRVAHLRTGVVLSPKGGALKTMLPPFRLGLGGPLGDGKAVMPWIALDDWLGCVKVLMQTAENEGPFNLTAPHPVTNKRFTQALGKVLHRPTVFPVPLFVPRLLLGEVVDEAIAASCQALPHRLGVTGHPFLFPTIDEALQHLLA